MNTQDNFNWDAAAFFEHLTSTNKHARRAGYVFERVSSLEGFQDALNDMYSAPAFVAVNDASQGSMSLDNSPHTRRIKTVFLAMRHADDDMNAREEAFADMRELFRQFMSMLILEKTRLEEHCIFIDERISFNEIDKYFFTGCACAYFQIAVDTYTNLVFDPTEWTDPDEKR